MRAHIPRLSDTKGERVNLLIEIKVVIQRPDIWLNQIHRCCPVLVEPLKKEGPLVRMSGHKGSDTIGDKLICTSEVCECIDEFYLILKRDETTEVQIVRILS